MNETNDNAIQVDIHAPLLDRIDLLIPVAKKSKLSEEMFEKYHDLITSIAVDLQLSQTQAVLLMPFIANPNGIVNYYDIRSFFDFSGTSFMRYTKDFKWLVHRRYLRHGLVIEYGVRGLGLTEKANKALSEGHGLPEEYLTNLSPNDFMKALNQTFEACMTLGEVLLEEFQEEMQALIDGNRHLAIIKALDSFDLDFDNKVFLLYFCKRIVWESQPSVSLDSLEELKEDFSVYNRDFLNGRQILMKKRLVKFDGGEQLYRDVYTLTKGAKKKLLKDYDYVEEELEKVDFGRFKVVKANDIVEKQLFYTEQNQKSIGNIVNLLSEPKWKEIRSSLKKNGMRQGFNCLFYGAPGTGKTETVLQLARSTGRDIMQVDISTIRDKWYGNTEKTVKEIFNQYGNLVKQSKRTPILLFNEADAVLSVRSDVSNSRSTDKTENAIQNILLQEMENLEGIMIATTNLVDNLDKAFERRFIYKIRFEQPSIEAKVSIWKSQLGELNDSDAATLAQNFDFSGGQIENVARKVFVEKLLFEKEVDLNRIIELCEEERIGSECCRKAIGFRV